MFFAFFRNWWWERSSWNIFSEFIQSAILLIDCDKLKSHRFDLERDHQSSELPWCDLKTKTQKATITFTIIYIFSCRFWTHWVQQGHIFKTVAAVLSVFVRYSYSSEWDSLNFRLAWVLSAFCGSLLAKTSVSKCVS